jgi:hypothetical protein
MVVGVCFLNGDECGWREVAFCLVRLNWNLFNITNVLFCDVKTIGIIQNVALHSNVSNVFLLHNSD